MKFGVIVFPGSNCDVDCYHALKNVFHQEVSYIWHDTEELEELDCIILPGGFSYGDYLRCGAVAGFSKVMDGVRAHAAQGKLLVGICNGFQILTEMGLLPGALVRNKDLKFICDTTVLKVENTQTPFTNRYAPGQEIRIPIAHGEGNYVAEEAVLKELQENGQIVFTYGENPNGSMLNIAGITNRAGNVLGMMPHPERACEALLGNEDGRGFFESILSYLEGSWNRG